MLGDNLKVHFAGSEQIDFSIVAHKAGVNGGKAPFPFPHTSQLSPTSSLF